MIYYNRTVEDIRLSSREGTILLPKSDQAGVNGPGVNVTSKLSDIFVLASDYARIVTLLNSGSIHAEP